MRLERWLVLKKVTSWVQVFRHEPTGKYSILTTVGCMYLKFLLGVCVPQHMSEGQETFVELAFSLSTTRLLESNLGHLSGLVAKHLYPLSHLPSPAIFLFNEWTVASSVETSRAPPWFHASPPPPEETTRLQLMRSSLRGCGDYLSTRNLLICTKGLTIFLQGKTRQETTKDWINKP